MPIKSHPVTNTEVMAYLDGELSPEAAAEMTAHLTQCRACQDVAADLQSVSRQVSGWTIAAGEAADQIPANIAAALTARDAAKIENTASGFNWHFFVYHRWVGVGALLLVLIPAIVFRTRTRTNKWNDQDVRYIQNAPAEPTAATMAPKPIPEADHSVERKQTAQEPLIVRTSDIRLIARNFDTVRVKLDRILAQFGGHIAQLNLTSPTGEARNLTATLRIPSPQLEAFLADLRKLGRVTNESQSGEEVTQQSIDLEARLNNARHTEERLTEILKTRTGKLSDVLEVEEKLSEVRGQIEQAEAEQKNLNNRISFATVSLQVTEDYRTPLAETAPTSVGTRLSNSAVDGLHTAFNGLIAAIQALLAAGPSVLLFGVLLALPAYFLWKKLRHRSTP